MKNVVLKSCATVFLLVFAIVGCKQEKKENQPAGQTEEVNLEARTLRYSTDSTEMTGYLVYNSDIEGKRPGILVVHEWWGHNEYTRKRADMLAEEGYTAMAIDMYGDGKQAKHPDDAAKFSGMVMQNRELAEARFDAAMEILKKDPSVDPDKIAAIGYCFGGSVVLTMANAGKDLAAVAAFHSGVELPVMPNEDLKARVLVANGGADPFISKESVTRFRKAMDSIGADYTYINYEDAKHAFTSKGADSLGRKFDLPLAYDKKADQESWKALLEFLNKTFN
ncbi:dienelactone hydrolase family protein [Zeaxanthinibacter enoshimensis]|uniref:Dienelactone hydrolase n=1 Tax=Zeaxanthinibacter enoshimensis TaxID=392009 RepID=A0A4R6TSE6_9FLAO|nr:dienelactone hydrolase family protein [Zeaxanthinibacter enoshimensis]TDQ31380.1 dienelactone hydrolase [Zeaxanthinibacter enoshimensis]